MQIAKKATQTAIRAAKPKVQTRQYTIVATVDKVNIDPKAGRPGYVPYGFTKEFGGFMRTKEIKHIIPEWQRHMDWSVRHANAKYTAPFTPEQYKALFGGNREDSTPAFYYILEQAHKLLSDANALKNAGADVDAKAWGLYKRFRFRATEDASEFGKEANASANALAEPKPASWTATQLTPITLTRALLVPPFLYSLTDAEFTAPAINIFRAWVVAFEKVASNPAEITKAKATYGPKVGLAKLQVLNPNYKTLPLTEEQLQTKLRENEDELEKLLTKNYAEFIVELKEASYE